MYTSQEGIILIYRQRTFDMLEVRKPGGRDEWGMTINTLYNLKSITEQEAFAYLI